jgi:hypothetical protein
LGAEGVLLERWCNALVVCWGVSAYEDDDATPANAVVEADGEELGDCNGGGEVVELVGSCQWILL